MEALFLRRPTSDDDGSSKESSDEDLSNVQVISSLTQVVDWVKRRNS
jgi:hypothetical protein